LGRKHPGFEGWRFQRNPARRSTLANLSSASPSKDQRLVRSQSVVARVIAGETLIVPVRARVGDLASIYSFNGTGSLIWKLLESPKTVMELAAAVAREYEVEPARAEQDVTEFVGEMKAVGLVEVAASMAMAGD
jgi:Coenzyme PQQ synthesis protein D (PqqD)